MHLKFTDSACRTSQIYWPAYGMADHYDPPGVAVHEDSDGTRHFRVVAAVGEQLLERDDIAEYDSE